MQVMLKLYDQMVMEKAPIKAEPTIQIGGLRSLKKNEDKDLAMAE